MNSNRTLCGMPQGFITLLLMSLIRLDVGVFLATGYIRPALFGIPV